MAGSSSAKTRFALVPGHDESESTQHPHDRPHQTRRQRARYDRFQSQRIDLVAALRRHGAEAADLVTEMTLVKHPFRAGVKAQKGIEF